MKLNSEDFTIINPSGDGDGPKPPGGGTPPPNVETWGEDEKEKSDGDSDGGDGSEPDYKIESADTGTAGGILTEEESKKLQKDMGVPEDLGTMSKEEIRDKIKNALNDPNQIVPDIDKKSGGYGSGSSNYIKALATMVRGKVDWKRMLKRFIGSKVTKEKQFLGNRRFLHSDDYVPASKIGDPDKPGKLVAAVDISGSMTDKEVAIVLNEVQQLVRLQKIEETVIIYFHHEIAKIVELPTTAAVARYKPERPGSGGTAFLPALETMNTYNKKGSIEVAVFLTDGDAELNLPKPRFASKFIWVIMNNPTFRPPWAGDKIVYINSEDLPNE